MFSKYFLLLAGLFLLDHGHSFHLSPEHTVRCPSSCPHQALSRPGPLRWDLPRVPGLQRGAGSAWPCTPPWY